jgi:hypothetical protein
MVCNNAAHTIVFQHSPKDFTGTSDTFRVKFCLANQNLALLNEGMNSKTHPHPSPLPEGEGIRNLAPSPWGEGLGMRAIHPQVQQRP